MRYFATTIFVLLLMSASFVSAQVTRWDAYKSDVTQLTPLAKSSSWAKADAVRQSLAVSLGAEVEAKLINFRKYAVEVAKQAPAIATTPDQTETEAQRLQRLQQKPAQQDVLSVLKYRSNREGELLYFIKTIKITDGASANLIKGYASELVTMLAEDEKTMSKK